MITLIILLPLPVKHSRPSPHESREHPLPPAEAKSALSAHIPQILEKPQASDSFPARQRPPGCAHLTALPGIPGALFLNI